MPGKTLDINASVWSKVYRAVVQKIKTNSDVKRVAKDRVYSWDGTLDDRADWAPSVGHPEIQLTPITTGVGWYDPSSQAGTLTVKVEIAVSSLCIDDAMDLFDAIATAVAPFGNDDFVRTLESLGAETGEIVFDTPAYDASPNTNPLGYFVATGSFRLKVIRRVAV